MLSLKRIAYLLLVLIILPSVAFAKPSFPDFVSKLKMRLQEDGFSKSFLDKAFHNVRDIHRTVYKDKHQPEVHLTLVLYYKHMLVPGRLIAGHAYMQKHTKILSQVEKKYQVEAKYVVALLGLESSYGKVMGNYPEISTLTTLIYNGHRAHYFLKELVYALKIIKNGDARLAQMKGSWAGAMGQPQFMPTHYYDYAVDFDGDGKKDIWHNTADVLASIAYSLHRYGWQYHAPIAVPVEFKRHVPTPLVGLRHHFPVAFWQQRGITSQFNLAPYKRDQAALLKLDDHYYLVFKNFRILYAWNRSKYYVMTVRFLANIISMPQAQFDKFLKVIAPTQ